MTGREVLFEITVIGETARVAAIDVASGIEVVTMGPITAGQAALEQLALRKLEKALGGSGEPDGENAAASRRGKLV